MGKKLDALLGRSFKISKFSSLVNLAISRLAVLKNQRRSRLSLARSDVLQLLNLGHHEHALLRVEHVIKEKNMLDVFTMIEGYSLLLADSVNLIEQDNKSNSYPLESRHAISSLIFAASRCGEFPELQEIRSLFTSRYGKEFTARAVELRNYCGVNPKIIQKLSTRQMSLEARMKALQDIANENGIILELDEFEAPNIAPQEIPKEVKEHQEVENKSFSSNSGDDLKDISEEIAHVEGVGSSMNRRKHYKDAADAAQDAFLSAAYAAAAARAAVELCKSSPRAPDDPNTQTKQVFHSKTEDNLIKCHWVNPIDTYSLNSEDGETNEGTESRAIRHTNLVDPIMKSTIGEVVFAKSDDDAKSVKLNSIGDEDPRGEGKPTMPYFSRSFQDGDEVSIGDEDPRGEGKQTYSSFQDGQSSYHSSHSSMGLTSKRLNSGKPMSVRTR